MPDHVSLSFPRSTKKVHGRSRAPPSPRQTMREALNEVRLEEEEEEEEESLWG